LVAASPALGHWLGGVGGSWVLGAVGVIAGLGGWLGVRYAFQSDLKKLRECLERQLDPLEHP
jgi:hypothetical protein